MAKKPENKAPEPINSVEALQQRIASMKEAQKSFPPSHKSRLTESFLRQPWQRTNSVSRWQNWLLPRPEWHCGGQSHQKPLRSGVYLQHL